MNSEWRRCISENSVAAQTVAFGALGVSLFYEAYYKNAKKEEAPAAVKPKEAAKPDAKA